MPVAHGTPREKERGTRARRDPTHGARERGPGPALSASACRAVMPLAGTSRSPEPSAAGALALQLLSEFLWPGGHERVHLGPPPTGVLNEGDRHGATDVLVPLTQPGGDDLKEPLKRFVTRLGEPGDAKSPEVCSEQMQQHLAVVVDQVPVSYTHLRAH